jgi:type IV pilus assembly protein PilW
MCAPDRLKGPRRRRQAGLSLVELMVGIVVSMLIGLAAAGSAMMFTASQRGGIGTGGTMVNANTVLAAIKGDAALAGLGFFVDDTPLCTTLNYSIGTAKLSDGGAFSPVRVTRAGDHDQLEVLYGSEIEGGTHVLLSSPATSTAAEVGAMINAAAGSTVLLAPDGIGLCEVRTVTSVAAFTASTPLTLNFASSGASNQASFATSTTYGTRSRVALLGNLRWNRYAVSGTNLVQTQPATDVHGTLLRNVMAFRVQYGVSANAATDTLSDWVDASGSWATLDATNSPRVRALRIGLILRSPQLEKRDASGNCVATTSAPTLFGSTPSGLTDDSNWGCYRYRVSTTVVPLRNLWTGRAQT